MIAFESEYFPPRDIVHVLRPSEAYSSFEWLCAEISMPDGKPFDADSYPWTRGICDAFDSPRVRLVALQFAARLGKTAIAQSLHVCSMAHKAGPTVFGSSTEGLAKQIVKKKLVTILRCTKETEGMIPPDHKLLQTRLDLDRMTVYVAWSGSPTTLADIDPYFLHGNEIDKWTKAESEEGDPLDLFLERGAERLDRKVIVESTPTIDGKSRINRHLHNGWNCRWQVPCWYCGRFQQLVVNLTGERDDGGLWWDRLANGEHPSANEARKTARYVCRHCKKDIEDRYRRPMIARGIWVPEGMRVSKAGRLLGQQQNDGPNATFQLSRIYAPTFTFHDFAEHYVATRGDLKGEQTHANSWEGETFVPRKGYERWESVAARLCGQYQTGDIAADVEFLTAGVDVQVDHLVYQIFGWRKDQSGVCIGFGVAEGWEELWDYLPRTMPDTDGIATPLRLVLIDSRNRSDEVILECRKRSVIGHRVFPCEGIRSSMMSGKPFNRHNLTDDRRQSRDVVLIRINTSYWQSWLDSCLIRRRIGDPNSIQYPASALKDQDLWEQMLNEIQGDKGSWVVINEHIPVDFRDCARYARVAAEVFTNAAWNRVLSRRKNEPRVRLEDAGPQPARRKRTWERKKITMRRRS